MSAEVSEIRSTYNNLAKFVVETIPPGRRRSLALTSLEESSMWAIKAATVQDTEL